MEQQHPATDNPMEETICKRMKLEEHPSTDTPMEEEQQPMGKNPATHDPPGQKLIRVDKSFQDELLEMDWSKVEYIGYFKPGPLVKLNEYDSELLACYRELFVKFYEAAMDELDQEDGEVATRCFMASQFFIRVKLYGHLIMTILKRGERIKKYAIEGDSEFDIEVEMDGDSQVEMDI